MNTVRFYFFIHRALGSTYKIALAKLLLLFQSLLWLVNQTYSHFCICVMSCKRKEERKREREKAKSSEAWWEREKINKNYILKLCVCDVHLAHQWQHKDREGQQEKQTWTARLVSICHLKFSLKIEATSSQKEEEEATTKRSIRKKLVLPSFWSLFNGIFILQAHNDMLDTLLTKRRPKREKSSVMIVIYKPFPFIL